MSVGEKTCNNNIPAVVLQNACSNYAKPSLVPFLAKGTLQVLSCEVAKADQIYASE